MTCPWSFNQSFLEDGSVWNSVPLSERRNSGAPCVLASLDRTSIARLERIDPATSMARHSRVNSATMVRHLICCPAAVALKTKS
jgi:hypothetical protein